MTLLESISPPARVLLNLNAINSDMVAVTQSLAPATQPVADVCAYLAERKPQPDIEGEESLLITLSSDLQKECAALLRACQYAASLVKDEGLSVTRACIEALQVHKKWGWDRKTFRAKFDLWVIKRDWVILVNRAKAPATWRPDNCRLPVNFLAYCETKLGKFKREDGKRQAVLSIHRNWRTGKNEDGNEFIVPGYEEKWARRDTENLPLGWSYPNILRQIRTRDRFNQTTRALLHESQSAALAHLPHILTDTTNLRFLEQITFDDVRMDWLVFDVETGQAVELWLLVARDAATRMVLGFVMHPANVRDDGTAAHLGARHMKELAADILQTYPLPPYLMYWKVERGTATLAEAVKLALAELFDNRIKVSYTKMIGGNSPVGYREKAKGNSRGKASHESHNRLFHTQSCHLPGQIGARYEIRPADLSARIEECKETWNLRQRLPEDKRGDEKYPLVVLQTKAREIVKQMCLEQNFRTDHACEGFEDVLEYFDEQTGNWLPASANSSLNTQNLKLRQRREAPVERAMRLIRAVDGKWTRPNPAIVKTFLEHNQRVEAVESNGEIKIPIDGKVKIFCHGGIPLAAGLKVLAYHCADDPQFIHLTSGDGRFLGTWYQRGRTPALDQKALAEAFRYTGAAASAAQAVARDLAAPQIAELEAMRAHNAELTRDFVVVTEPSIAMRDSAVAVTQSPISAALAATATTKISNHDKARLQARQRAEDDRLAREALANI